jgi:hypothetical protein
MYNLRCFRSYYFCSMPVVYISVAEYSIIDLLGWYIIMPFIIKKNKNKMFTSELAMKMKIIHVIFVHIYFAKLLWIIIAKQKKNHKNASKQKQKN